MKRIFFIFLFLLVATTLFSKEITISFWHILGYHVTAVIEELIDEYNEIHPNIKVKSSFQGFFEDAQIKMLTAAIGKQLPDVAQIPFEFLEPYVENGFIEPIDDEIPEDVKRDVIVQAPKFLPPLEKLLYMLNIIVFSLNILDNLK